MLLNRWSALLVILGLLLVYAAAGRPAEAQVSALPFDIGDEVWLTYESDRSTSCRVAEIRGIYIRCHPVERTRIGTRPPDRWQSLEGVRTIERHVR